jgi:hypothetical protein
MNINFEDLGELTETPNDKVVDDAFVDGATDDDHLLGIVTILGVNHHVCFLKVHVVDGIQQPVRRSTEMLDELTILVNPGGPFDTVEIPGHEGEYVCWVEPSS